jgi:hypothetical protein
MTLSQIWSLRECRGYWRWSRAALAVLCAFVTLLNGIKVSFQGNGNPSWSGLFIGVALGLAWSVLLLFGFTQLAHGFRMTWRAALAGLSLLAGLVLLPVISIHLWGHLQLNVL